MGIEIQYFIFAGSDVMVSSNENTLAEDQVAFIGLPPGLFDNITLDTLGIFFTFYSDGSLFPFEDQTGRDNITRVVGSAVIGAAIANETITGLQEDDQVTTILLLQRSVRLWIKA